MPIRALVLDLDGLIVDTESTDFGSWESVYRDHGERIPLDRWVAAIGTDTAHFDPLEHLAERVGRRFDLERVSAERRRRRDALIRELRPLPGVVELLESAAALGMAAGVASSSPRRWVEGHLERVGLRAHFRVLACGDEVERVKPDPALYRAALAALGAGAGEAVAFEDSPHGVAAAKAAGLFCVAVPGPMTRGLAFDAADLVLGSLAERPLAELLARAGG